jgi:hypothetical protein
VVVHVIRPKRVVARFRADRRAKRERDQDPPDRVVRLAPGDEHADDREREHEEDDPEIAGCVREQRQRHPGGGDERDRAGERKRKRFRRGSRHTRRT